MKDTDTIAIYYIVTGPYKVLFPEFLDSLGNFFPNHQKTVKLISDGLEEYKDYQKGNVCVELCPRINHYPWPVITLYKMWHIQENLDEQYDYSCYFNGNSFVYPHREDIFDYDKLNVSYHSFDKKNNPYDPWEQIAICPQSSAYLENKTYEYTQAAFFFGKTSIIKAMCQDVLFLLKQDMYRCIFALWHDESYLNKWCNLHSNLVHRDHYLTVYPDIVDPTCFIYLRDKKNYSIEKK